MTHSWTSPTSHCLQKRYTLDHVVEFQDLGVGEEVLLCCKWTHEPCDVVFLSFSFLSMTNPIVEPSFDRWYARCWQVPYSCCWVSAEWNKNERPWIDVLIVCVRVRVFISMCISILSDRVPRNTCIPSLRHPTWATTTTSNVMFAETILVLLSTPRTRLLVCSKVLPPRPGKSLTCVT